MKGASCQIAVGQMHAETCAVNKNLSKMELLVTEAAASGAIVIALPELCVTGYRADDRFSQLGQRLDGEYVKELTRISGNNGGIWIYTAIPEDPGDGGKPYNTGVLVNSQGLAACYRKVHLWGMETAYFRPGNALVTADTPAGRAGLHICFDVSFPECARHSALAGADLLMYVFAFANPERRYAFDALTQARALENGCYVMAANLVEGEKDTQFFGGSRILDPAGVELVNAGRREGVICAAMGSARLKAVRTKYPYLSRRRAEIYGL